MPVTAAPILTLKVTTLFRLTAWSSNVCPTSSSATILMFNSIFQVVCCWRCSKNIINLSEHQMLRQGVRSCDLPPILGRLWTSIWWRPQCLCHRVSTWRLVWGWPRVGHSRCLSFRPPSCSLRLKLHHPPCHALEDQLNGAEYQLSFRICAGFQYVQWTVSDFWVDSPSFRVLQVTILPWSAISAVFVNSAKPGPSSRHLLPSAKNN